MLRNCWLSEWLRDWLNDWLNDSMTDDGWRLTAAASAAASTRLIVHCEPKTKPRLETETETETECNSFNWEQSLRNRKFILHSVSCEIAAAQYKFKCTATWQSWRTCACVCVRVRVCVNNDKDMATPLSLCQLLFNYACRQLTTSRQIKLTISFIKLADAHTHMYRGKTFRCVCACVW